MDTLEVLIAARAEVEKGWCREPQGGSHVGENDDGKVCAVGAVWRVTGEYPFRVSVALESACLEAAPDSICVALWNDDAATTKPSVLALYDRAINSLVAARKRAEREMAT